MQVGAAAARGSLREQAQPREGGVPRRSIVTVVCGYWFESLELNAARNRTRLSPGGMEACGTLVTAALHALQTARRIDDYWMDERT